MQHDPLDETYRKARRLRNTPLQKYIRITSAIITLMFAGAMYISYRRNILPLLNDEEYKKKISEEDRALPYDFMSSEFMKGVIGKLEERRETKLKADTESKNQVKDTQANKD